MCEECEQAESLAAVYVRKANRYGWRPPQPATAPRSREARDASFCCAPTVTREPQAKVS